MQFHSKKLLHFFFFSEMEKFPPCAHNMICCGWQLSFKACCKGSYWEKAGMCHSTVSRCIFGLGDCGRLASKLMFPLCFRHVMLAVCVMWLKIQLHKWKTGQRNKVTCAGAATTAGSAVIQQLLSWGVGLWGSARCSHPDQQAPQNLQWQQASCSGSSAHPGAETRLGNVSVWGEVTVQPTCFLHWWMLGYGIKAQLLQAQRSKARPSPILNWSSWSWNPLPCLFPGPSRERCPQASPWVTS